MNYLSRLWALVVFLVVIWALAFFVANLGPSVHVLLVLALIALVWTIVTGSRRTI